jgi:hypothetical protein
MKKGRKRKKSGNMVINKKRARNRIPRMQGKER